MMMHKLWLTVALFGTTTLQHLESSSALSSLPQLGRIRRNVLVHHQTLLLATPDDDDDTSSAVLDSASSLRDEAQSLKAKAERLRREIEQQRQKTRPSQASTTTNNVSAKGKEHSPTDIATNPISLPWSLSADADDGQEGEEYRLYVDIGREEGTWMDARWGASGNRIPFSLDIQLHSSELADDALAAKMVKDNNMGKSSKVFALKTAPFARLRDGFDRMQCCDGAYRIDLSNNGRYTIRMMVQVEGTKADQNYMYGDVSIPKGCLYFSLPCFGGRIDQLSTKDGPVTVRQTGWHTGWRREESRIVGVFQAKPLADARRRDSY